MSSNDGITWKSIVIGIGIVFIFLGCIYRIIKEPKIIYPIQVKSNPRSISFLLFRILSFLFFLIVWIIQIYDTNWFNLVYYTYWNFTLQTFYFAIAIVFQLRRWKSTSEEIFRPLNVLFDVCFTSCFLVALVYWILLFNPSKLPDWATYIVHAVNVVIFLIEFALNDYVIQRTSLKYIILWPLMYVVVTWISNATYLDGFWPYALMSLTKTIAPLIWFGIGFGHVLCFGLGLVLSSYKIRVMPLQRPSATSTDVQTYEEPEVHVEIVSPRANEVEKEV